MDEPSIRSKSRASLVRAEPVRLVAKDLIRAYVINRELEPERFICEETGLLPSSELQYAPLSAASTAKAER